MRARLVISFCCAALAILAPCEAADRRGGESLDRVLPHIRATVPGTFYDAEGPFFSPEGQPSYRIKWMTPDGRLIWFSVDARSGQVMGGGARGYGSAPEPRNSDNRGSSWNQPRGNFRDDTGAPRDNRDNRDSANRSWGTSRPSDNWGSGGDARNDRGGWGADRNSGRDRSWGAWGSASGGNPSSAPGPSRDDNPRYNRGTSGREPEYRAPNRSNEGRSNDGRSGEGRSHDGRQNDNRQNERTSNDERHDRHGR